MDGWVLFYDSLRAWHQSVIKGRPYVTIYSTMISEPCSVNMTSGFNSPWNNYLKCYDYIMSWPSFNTQFKNSSSV